MVFLDSVRTVEIVTNRNIFFVDSNGRKAGTSSRMTKSQSTKFQITDIAEHSSPVGERTDDYEQHVSLFVI